MTKKLFVEVDLGIVEIETRAGHGNIDEIWFGGIKASNMSVAELIEILIPPAKWSSMIEKAAQEDQGPDRIEDEYGVPI